MFLNSSSILGTSVGFLNRFVIPAIWIPILLPNRTVPPIATRFCKTIMLQNLPAHNMGTTHPLTAGDEYGVACFGGTTSLTSMSMCRYTSSSSSVFLENIPAARFLDNTSQNSGNTNGTTLVPHQTHVMALS